MGWSYFSDEEMQCHCGCGELSMNENFMRDLVELRGRFGRALPITSGFRCWKHEQQLYQIPDARLELAKVAPGHYHTRGLAADIHLEKIETAAIHRLLKLVFDPNSGLLFTGVGQKIHGPWSGRLLHLDAGRDEGIRPAVWTYP